MTTLKQTSPFSATMIGLNESANRNARARYKYLPLFYPHYGI